MAGDDAEKSEEPTGKKISEARKKGQVAQSQELSAFVSLVVAALMLMWLGPHMGKGMAQIMTMFFTVERANLYDPTFVVRTLVAAFADALSLVWPMFLVMFIAAFIAPLYMAGFLFSASVMQPKFSKMNPLKGIKRIFGVQGLVNLGKALLKVLLVGSFLVITIKNWMPELLIIAQEPMKQAFAHIADAIFLFFLILSSSLILVALVDVPFQKWNTHRQLKMTKQEVKDEHKSSEGAPEIKQRIRQAQQEAARRRMMDDVPNADVVITNPTHFAVALQYEENSMAAPIVVAKGADLVAAQIRSRALSAEVPLVQVPPLARAIFYHTEIDHPIPAGLFLAVAKVLAYVFQLRQAGLGPKPVVPRDIVVPEEYLKD